MYDHLWCIVVPVHLIYNPSCASFNVDCFAHYENHRIFWWIGLDLIFGVIQSENKKCVGMRILHFCRKSVNNCIPGFCKIKSLQLAKVDYLSPRFSRNLVGIAGNSSWLPMTFPKMSIRRLTMLKTFATIVERILGSERCSKCLLFRTWEVPDYVQKWHLSKYRQMKERQPPNHIWWN